MVYKKKISVIYDARNSVKLPDVLEFFVGEVVSPGYSGKFEKVQWISPDHGVPVFGPLEAIVDHDGRDLH